jgi:hypothetical protein
MFRFAQHDKTMKVDLIGSWSVGFGVSAQMRGVGFAISGQRKVGRRYIQSA